MLDELVAQLLQFKALPPRDPEWQPALDRIARLDTSAYNETDVRAEIIEPLLRVLGYDVETWASLKRERAIRVAGSSKLLDYSMRLFEEDFWIIEAKRPGKEPRFDREVVYQALRYAAHPEINAALMMLCDGEKIEIYDREENLETPLLRLARGDWARDIDLLRTLLSPWQAFFFERRRALRLFDKVVDREINLGRVEELRNALDRRLVEKRGRVLQNWRDHAAGEPSAYSALLAEADPVELVETEFFAAQTGGDMKTMVANVARDRPGRGQLIGLRIFPEAPRSANIAFWGNALHVLLECDRAGGHPMLLPTWLGHGSYAGAIERLGPLLLTCFRADRARRIVLLHATSARRMLKLHLMFRPDTRQTGELMHAVGRFLTPELSFAQHVSSPAGHLLGLLDVQQVVASGEFVRQNCDRDTRHFAAALAEQQLRALWQAERDLLENFPHHLTLRKDLGLNEIHWSEAEQCWYDALGHLALCVIDQYPAWRTWTLATHGDLIEELARGGSWKACDWLGIDPFASRAPLDPNWNADRFFLGDEATAAAIIGAYRVRG